VTHTRRRINTINSPDDEHRGAGNMLENWNKYTRKRIVSQVGQLQELNRDARSTKYKIQNTDLASPTFPFRKHLFLFIVLFQSIILKCLDSYLFIINLLL